MTANRVNEAVTSSVVWIWSSVLHTTHVSWSHCVLYVRPAFSPVLFACPRYFCISRSADARTVCEKGHEHTDNRDGAWNAVWSQSKASGCHIATAAPHECYLVGNVYWEVSGGRDGGGGVLTAYLRKEAFDVTLSTFSLWFAFKHCHLGFPDTNTHMENYHIVSRCCAWWTK